MKKCPVKGSNTVAVFVSFSGDGGVEKMVSHLAAGFLQEGYKVDFVLIKAKGAHLDSIPTGARVINLGCRTWLTSVPGLIRYLRSERPSSLLAAKDRAGRAALLARRMAKVPTRVVLRLGMHLSQSLEGKTRLEKALRIYPMRLLYPWADGIIAVSDGVADDLAAVTHIPRSGISVLANPVITPELHRMAAQESLSEWFSRAEPALIVAVGRLTRQKGFDVLLSAFAELLRHRRASLLILGEGPERQKLERQAEELGLGDRVHLPGFDANPYAYLARADLFVLSSRFEGSPNVLKEALALGTPVVATDCRSGPREILKDGRYGPLVPVDDPKSLAEAMERVLAAPPDRESLPRAVSDYTLRASARAYLRELGLEPSASEDDKHTTDI
ncbi:MAG: glycosyltransferase [Desulfohalobiaceae bacterium]